MGETEKAYREFLKLKRIVANMEHLVKGGQVNYFKAKQSIMLTEQLLRDLTEQRNTVGDSIIVYDDVVVYYGTPETPESERQIVFASKGHIVNQGLIGIVNLLSGRGVNVAAGMGLPSGSIAATTGWSTLLEYMRVGTGGSVTTGATVGLTAINNTVADSQSGTNSNPSGSYRIAWLATWNAGTLTAITVTEIGMWLCLDTSLNTFEAIATSANAQFFSRLSEADGDFTAFIVNTAVPLTIEWRLTFTFA